ncbi:MAG: class I SAM-dependent methyltransferase [Acidimicrobiales bacterium]
MEGPDLCEWLSPFPAPVAKDVQRVLSTSRAGLRLVGPADHSTGLRPVAAVRDLLHELAQLEDFAAEVAARPGAPADRETESDPGHEARRLVWLADQNDPSSLTMVEAEALFGTVLALELVALAVTGVGTSRLVVVGRLRREVLALVLTLGQSSWRSALAVASVDPAPAVLLAGRDRAIKLLTRSGRGMAQLRLLVSRGMALGCDVSAGHLELFLADPQGWVAPLRELTGSDSAVLAIRFRDPRFLDRSAAVLEALGEAGIELDLSLSKSGPGPLVPYLPNGAFQPHSHDLRSPAGSWFPGRPVTAVRHESGALGTAEGWNRLWTKCTMHRLPTLARLVAFRRKEAYFNAVAGNPRLWSAYPEYLVHNWPRPDPAERVTVVDLGEPRRGRGGARNVQDAARVWLREARPAPVLADHARLIQTARREAHSRVTATAGSALVEQVAHHGYLGAGDPEAPLRQDLVEFTAFVPGRLGHVLEVGSGFGQLARNLSPRSVSYVGLDLVAAGLSLQSRGVVADAHQLPFSGHSFDTVVANNSLEHLYDPVAALSEIRRVLRPGGHLLALLPLDFLGPEHRLPAHLWKADRQSVELAFRSAELRIARYEVLDLAILGIPEAFPSCKGLVAQIDAESPGPPGH